jgi:sporulation-control protein spo0M
MGFFDKIKAAVGIGQPKVDFTLQSNQIKRGESIKGKITATAGTKETPVKFFLIEHVEIVTRREWSDSLKKMVDKEIKNTVNKIQIQKNDEMLMPGTTMDLDFELPVSSSAMNTGHPYKHELKVSIDVPGLDPSKRADIFIL